MTLFEQCVEAADPLVGQIQPDTADIARAVLTCLLENTGSPRTRDELTRLLGDA